MLKRLTFNFNRQKDVFDTQMHKMILRKTIVILQNANDSNR